LFSIADRTSAEVLADRIACQYGEVPPTIVDAVRLIAGDDEFLVSRAVRDAVDNARSIDPDVEIHEYAGGEMTPEDLDEALSPSLFGGRRVVIVNDVQDAKKEMAAAILAYVNDRDPDVTLVLTHAGGAKGKALVDGVRAAKVTEVAAGKLSKSRERVDFVRDEVRRLGGKIDEAAAEALLAAIGNDLRDLAAACTQLVADTGGQLTAAVISRYYRGRAEVSGFTVADAALVGDVPAALEALRWARGVGVDPVPIADALADGVRTVARVAAAGRGNAYQLAAVLGMPAWKIERAQRQARGWTPEALADAMRVAADCNAAVKGGAEDRDYALEQAVFAMVAARASGSGVR
jgi:DNA polymerase-3 subunit delta